ncbi:hypothetical protein ACU8V7_23070 [Zobellia nedashkovskayae]
MKYSTMVSKYSGFATSCMGCGSKSFAVSSVAISTVTTFSSGVVSSSSVFSSSGASDSCSSESSSGIKFKLSLVQLITLKPMQKKQ